MQLGVLDGVSRSGGEALQSLNCALQSGVPVNRIINGVYEDSSEVRAISMLTVLEVGAGQQVHCKDGFSQAVVIVSVVGSVGDRCLPDNLVLQTRYLFRACSIMHTTVGVVGARQGLCTQAHYEWSQHACAPFCHLISCQKQRCVRQAMWSSLFPAGDTV